jgi:hypothetical protein
LSAWARRKEFPEFNSRKKCSTPRLGTDNGGARNSLTRGELAMREKVDKKEDLEQPPEVAKEPAPALPASESDSKAADVAAELDAEEEEFRAIRRDLPGVKGSSAAGIVAISVGKTPSKNEFFRAHPDFRPIIPIVDFEAGMERQFFAVTADMIGPLGGIGITVTDHTLYLTVTSRGALRIVPVRHAVGDGEQNEYHRTKEIGLMRAIHEWVRFFTDQENRCYQVFPAPVGRFGEPQFPNLSQAKIFKLAFTDKGRKIDSPEHIVFKKWAARDSD